ncbi:hypothetical protein CLOM_g23329 [Closterium sp. NIES-68]|nr:hypothetical protein CLOM_g23329 [Closterium sp. NIES-68]
MTLIHLYRKYKRWNPVHPTLGAFWGFGVGLGCGVGWGPGFGPEVVGYVGAGCGVGFNIGVTLIGVGIGLPASDFARLPCDAAFYAGDKAVKFAGGTVVPALDVAARSGWQHAVEGTSSWRRSLKQWGPRVELENKWQQHNSAFQDFWKAAASTVLAAHTVERAIMRR